MNEDFEYTIPTKHKQFFGNTSESVQLWESYNINMRKKMRESLSVLDGCDV